MDLWIYSVALAVVGIPIAFTFLLYFFLRGDKEAEPFKRLVLRLKGLCWFVGIASVFFWFTLFGLLPVLNILRRTGYPLDIISLPPEVAIQITNLVVGSINGIMAVCFLGVCFSIAKFLEQNSGGFKTVDETAPPKSS